MHSSIELNMNDGEQQKTLEDLPVPDAVHAPSGRGSVDVNVLRCLSCEQPDATKILVVSEKKQNIKHNKSPEGGDEAMVYEVQCQVCNEKYKLGIITIEGETPSGTTTMGSAYVMDKNTKEKWAWLGYF